MATRHRTDRSGIAINPNGFRDGLLYFLFFDPDASLGRWTISSIAALVALVWAAST